MPGQSKWVRGDGAGVQFTVRLLPEDLKRLRAEAKGAGQSVAGLWKSLVADGRTCRGRECRGWVNAKAYLAELGEFRAVPRVSIPAEADVLGEDGWAG